jgi:alpha-L-arabinofuranosidase
MSHSSLAGWNFASGYNWKDGIGPKDQRPTRIDLAWNDLESNRFGTDEFLRYCEMLGAEPYICINAGLGTVDARLTGSNTAMSHVTLTGPISDERTDVKNLQS